MVNQTDRTLVSQCDIGRGAVLQRVINRDGEPYSLILVGDDEVWSCPTVEEAEMVRQWIGWGWRAFA